MHIMFSKPGQEGDSNSLADILALMQAHPVLKSQGVDHLLPCVCTTSAITLPQNKGSLGCSSRSD